MNPIMFLVVVLLFTVLTPGVLLKLPSAKSSPLVIALTHGVVFALALTLLYKPLWRLTRRLVSGFDTMEGLEDNTEEQPEKEEDKEEEDKDE